jgi:hypothetical protein
MRFDFEELVDAPTDVVEEAFTDPAFYESIKCSSALAVREVVGRSEEDGAVTLRIRFAFTGDVSSAVRRFVDPARLTWVTAITQRSGVPGSSFDILPDHYPGLLKCQGAYRYGAQPGGGTTLLGASGDLSVKVPIVGRPAERAIAQGFHDFVGDQARALAARAS